MGEGPDIFQTDAATVTRNEVFLHSLNCVIRKAIQGIKLQLVV